MNFIVSSCFSPTHFKIFKNIPNLFTVSLITLSSLGLGIFRFFLNEFKQIFSVSIDQQCQQWNLSVHIPSLLDQKTDYNSSFIPMKSQALIDDVFDFCPHYCPQLIGVRQTGISLSLSINYKIMHNLCNKKKNIVNMS